LIAILDYGSGNLRSALRAFESTGRKVQITSDPEIAINAAGLVVPGVGAFATCMQGLISAGGDQIIKHRIANQKPTFGICVGMQILFQSGSENGLHQGVGVVDGVVEKLAAPVLPHMGWNTLRIEGESQLFKGINRGDARFYFVHSFGVIQSGNINFGKFSAAAYSDYYGEFLAAFEFGSISATQFHPEKSGANGIKLIQNWVANL
jgi:glutamine amidotransferase